MIKAVRKPALWFGVLLYCLLSYFSGFSFAATANTMSNTGVNTGPDMTASQEKRVEFEQLNSGQYIVEVMLNGEKLRMMLDTAATRTSIFDDIARRLGLEISGESLSFINGINSSGFRPSVMVDNISFANKTLNHHKIIVLDRLGFSFTELDGILGIDILKDMVLTFNHEQKTIIIGDRPALSKKQLRKWTKTRLYKNPHKQADYGLYFVKSRIGNKTIPTLIDTGANFTAINWKGVKFTEAWNEYKRLRKNWEIKGAIGEFRPKTIVRFDSVIIGKTELENHLFLLMDFDNLPINNYGQKKLAIAGIDIFAGRDFVLDLKNRKLYMPPQKKKPVRTPVYEYGDMDFRPLNF